MLRNKVDSRDAKIDDMQLNLVNMLMSISTGKTDTKAS